MMRWASKGNKNEVFQVLFLSSLVVYPSGLINGLEATFQILSPAHSHSNLELYLWSREYINKGEMFF